MTNQSLRVLVASLLPPVLALAGPLRAGPTKHAASSFFVRWTFREDFGHGIPAWMSFPLAQDIGYDPSLYTTTVDGSAVLVRDVTAEGQRVLRLGVLKPLRFRGTASSSFHWHYTVQAGGPVRRMLFLLAAEDGQKYKTSLPMAAGDHGVRISGKQLGLPTAGASVTTVVLEADVESPTFRSSNRLIIAAFEIEAEREPKVPIKVPNLVHSSAEDVAVADLVISKDSSLAVASSGDEPLEVSLYEGAGAPVRSQIIQAQPTRPSKPLTVSLGPNPLPGLWRAEIESGRARTDFRFLVLGEIPPHPRVLLRARRFEELSSLKDSDALLRAMHAKAAELRSALAYNPLAGENIRLLPPWSVFPGLPQYFNLMENYSNAIAFNAVEYRLTGDREALAAARRALLTISQWPTWTPTWFAAHGLHTYYEVGVFTQRVACGYDLIADELSAAEKSQVAEALWRNSIRPTIEEYFFFDRMPTAASNHMANSVGGAISAVVALYDDLPDWNGRLGLALAELTVAYEHLLDGLFPGDGSEAEPAGYEQFAMEGMSWGMAGLDAFGIRPHGYDKMMQAFWWPRYAEVSPGLVLDTGDFGEVLGALSGFAWGAEHSGDPALRAFYDTAVNGTVLGTSSSAHTGHLLEMDPRLLDLACCSKPPAPTPLSPPSQIFPGRGSAALRSGWNADDTAISIRVGPWFNHEHHDQGSFQVAAFGEKLVAEAGYADYYRDLHYQDYFIQAAGHNTVLIDDDPFSQPGENGRFWKALSDFPRFSRHVLSPVVDFISANLAPAYDGALASFDREYVFLKPAILIVQDKLRALKPHRYEWLLHIPIGAQMRAAGDHALIIGKDAAAALTATGESTQWSLQSVPLAGGAYGDLDRTRLEQPYEFRLESSPGVSATFLVGMEFQKLGAEVVPPSTVSIPAGRGFAAMTPEGTWTAVFKSHPGSLETGGISTDGDALAFKSNGEGKEVFGSKLHTMTERGKLLLDSSAPLDAVWRLDGGQQDLYLFSEHGTSVKIFARGTPAEVTLDGNPVSPTLSNGNLSLESLGEGEHVVRIRY